MHTLYLGTHVDTNLFLLQRRRIEFFFAGRAPRRGYRGDVFQSHKHTYILYVGMNTHTSYMWCGYAC